LASIDMPSPISRLIPLAVATLIVHGVAGGAELLTLDKGIELALAQNPDARLADHRIAAARAALREANSAFWPKVQFRPSYVGTDNPASVFMSAINQREFTPGLDFNHPPTVDHLNVKGTVSVPLYHGGRMVAGREAATAMTEAARRNADAVRNRLAFEVSRAWFSILKTREFIQSAEASVKSFESNLSIAQKRRRAGNLLKAETLDVEVKLAEAREGLVRAQNARALAERALRNLLGIDRGELKISNEVPRIEMPSGRDFSQRSELQAADQRIHAARAGLRGARGGHRPKVNGFASLDYDTGWRFGGSGKSWTIGMALEWDIFDGHRTDAKVDSARARLDSAIEMERKIRLMIDLEVEQASLKLGESSQRLEVTEKAIDLATESRDLTRIRFQEGAALSTQLINAETALTAARVRRAEAGADRRIAAAALRQALGLPQIPKTPTTP
jgi:outer membrane protein